MNPSVIVPLLMFCDRILMFLIGIFLGLMYKIYAFFMYLVCYLVAIALLSIKYRRVALLFSWEYLQMYFGLLTALLAALDLQADPMIASFNA